MTPREQAEQIAEEQLKTWPTDAPWGILRTAIRNDLMIPAIERAISVAVADEREACAKITQGLRAEISREIEDRLYAEDRATTTKPTRPKYALQCSTLMRRDGE